MVGAPRLMLLFLLTWPIVLYLLFQVWVLLGHFRNSDFTNDVPPPAVSIIVPFRNESKNIEALIQSFQNLNYPRELLEFIFVDDHSTDDSLIKLREKLRGFPFAHRILQSDSGKEGKKRALHLGIMAAVHPIVVSRDADTFHNHPNWLLSLTRSFCDKSVKMVAGPVEIKWQKGFIAQYQRLEQAALNTVAKGAIQNQTPLFCSGANLAFRKADFLALNGYESHWNQVSGDDVFLMQEMQRTHPGSIAFASQKEAIVNTYPETNYTAYRMQKLRWVKKVRPGFNPLFFLGMIIFLARINTILIPVLSLLFPQWSFIFISLALCTVLFDFLLVLLSSGLTPMLQQIPVFIMGLIWQVPVSIDLVLFSERKDQYWKERRIL